MAKSTKSKENENYWGYIIFAALILVYINFSDDIWNNINSTDRTNRTNYRDTRQTNSQPKNSSTSAINYCSLPSATLIKQLTNERNYKLNGYGSVQFTQRFDHARNQWVENKIIIAGNGKRLEGNWKLLANNKIRITNVMATGGNFDASNNSKTRGMLIVKCDGSLKGMLTDPNGNTRDILINKRR
ncbi:hypothetical protein [uncultured Algibacter sp.]|uniref:hypothetical protein n=1 Tax=uncultured Algibacter sp. TaxID=298659 RepID=UPI0032180BC8